MRSFNLAVCSIPIIPYGSMNAGFVQDWEYELGGYDPEALDISSQFAVTVFVGFHLQVEHLGHATSWDCLVMTL